MRLETEVGVAQLRKHQESLSGDAVRVIKKVDSTLVVLSDGLGSGAKADLLATTAVETAVGMLDCGTPIGVVMAAVTDALARCPVQGQAYATLAVVQIDSAGKLLLYEYDSPEIMVFRHNRLLAIERNEMADGGRKILGAHLSVEPNDVVVVVSDGVLHAGIDALFAFGLGQAGLLEYLPPLCSSSLPAGQLADKVIELAADCSLGKAGDDCTAIVIRVTARQPNL